MHIHMHMYIYIYVYIYILDNKHCAPAEALAFFTKPLLELAASGPDQLGLVNSKVLTATDLGNMLSSDDLWDLGS